MKVTSEIQGPVGTVKLDGRFTFETHTTFNLSTRGLLQSPGLKRMILDMEHVEHMDASSLGAVLLLREATEARFVAITLRRPSPQVMALLRVVQFEKLFEIEA